MKTLMLSAAVIAFSGAAYAQDAYISQVGDGMSAVNYSELNDSGNTNRDNLQVIAQQGVTVSGSTGFGAANLASGRNNTSYIYQMDRAAPETNPSNNSSGSSMNALTWQDGDNNSAVAVQLINQGPARKSTHVSQILQAGNNNVGINWTQNTGGGLPALAPAINAPTLVLNPATSVLPTPIANATVPFGTSVSIN